QYICLGAQPHNTSPQHWRYVRERGGVIRISDEVRYALQVHLRHAVGSLGHLADQVYVTIDADVVQSADVPGVSAPNSLGLSGREVIACAQSAGRLPQVSSFDLVELNPRYDVDGRSLRWGALVVWNFLIGLAGRNR